MEQISELLEAALRVAEVVCWPVVVFAILLYFGAPLRRFLREASEVTLGAGASGFQATLKRQQIEAAAMLGAATAKSAANGAGSELVPDEERARGIAGVVDQSVRPGLLRRLSQASVLWVDDNPSNNRYERAALEALGIQSTISTTTEDALERIRAKTYDVIISDMGRPPDNRAGYTLLDEKRDLGDQAPFIIYAGSNRPEHKAEARRRGALGSTNDPQELFQLVIGAIQAGDRC
jgi:CheY-like chemotaxis protein